MLDRDIDFRGERFTERITLEQPHRVTFPRIAGPVLGTIVNEIEGGANEIEGPEDDLRLRFSFALVVEGVAGRPAAARGDPHPKTPGYLKAAAPTRKPLPPLPPSPQSPRPPSPPTPPPPPRHFTAPPS